MASVKRNVKKAYRALKRAKFSRRIAKAGANNVGKATFKAKKKSRGRRKRPMRRRKRY